MLRDQNQDPAAPPGVIIAGGLGSRIGGNKPFAELRGEPLLAHMIDRLAPQCGALAINVAETDPMIAQFGLPLIRDPDDSRPGPLAGIATALRWARDALEAERVVTVPVDAPLLPPDFVARLLASSGPARIARSAGQPHPVAALFDVALLDGLETFLKQDRRRAMMGWLDRVGATIVDFDPVVVGGEMVDPFFNVNTTTDLERAERLLSKR
ncbi:molybdenum cofactor guanylyltransferase MobA [Amorphus sp. 3PC139-8]|uniref:molybdenum cofactor guanylyltransferase MobA n=1 Tax=Amorphus sp. 3PC139-8 TaxID=2735676 RepID=UPI00345DBD89